MNDDCLFCRIGRGEIPADLVFENDELIAFKDINPQAPAHILVVPRKHVATLNDLTDEDASLVGKMVLCARTLAADMSIAEPGFRLVMNCNEQGGQTVFHIHLHLMGGRQLLALG